MQTGSTRTGIYGHMTLDDTGGIPTLFDPAATAQLLNVTIWTLERWRREGGGPTYVRLGPGDGSIRYHCGDLDKYLASRRVEPLDEILDGLPDELSAAVRRALPQIRRELPHAIVACAAALRLDPDSLAPNAKHLLAGGKSFRFCPGVAGLLEVELAHLWSDVVRLRDARRDEGGKNDPTAGASIIDLDGWKLLEPRLGGGIVWAAAVKTKRFRIHKGSAECLSVFGPSRAAFMGNPTITNDANAPRGLTPLSKTLVNQLIEENADFRVALAHDVLRFVDVPGAHDENR